MHIVREVLNRKPGKVRPMVDKLRAFGPAAGGAA